MDQFENNGAAPENTPGSSGDNADNASFQGENISASEQEEQPSVQQPAADNARYEQRPVNRSGGVFEEQSFAERVQAGGNYPNGYSHNGYAQNGAAGADMQYRSMYGYYNNGQNTQPYSQQQAYSQQSYGQPQGGTGGQGGYPPYQAPMQQNYAQTSYEPQSEIPPVSGTAQAEMKRSSKIWIVIVVFLAAVLLAAVMLMLAVSHKDDGEKASVPDKSNLSQGVTVNISVQPHPADDDMYADKEKGLFTTSGAAEQVLPSIVNLYGYTSTSIAAYNEASGIIISEDGYIITNAHAVENIKRFKAKLHDGREFEARVVGMDTRTDLAVMKIEAEDLVPAVIGSSSDMKQGEQVVAIGNAGGFNDTVTVGYVSYVDREIKSYTGYPINCIQTDAALNFGNSGGALINLYGQVVGIVVSKYSSTGSENIGFAIASDFAVPIAEDLIEQGYVSGRARIGIIYTLITAENAAALEVKPGMLIAEIDPGCDVANTDLQVDDIITELNGKQMLTSADIMDFQNTAKAGDKVTAKVYRKTITGEESEFEIEFTLEEYK